MNAQQMVRDLQGSGLTQTEIAEIVGTGQSYISGLARGDRGKRLGWEIGNALKALWEARCGGTDVPDRRQPEPRRRRATDLAGGQGG